MASIDRTAYPRFKRVVSARELAEAFSPTPDEAEWARSKTTTDQHFLALVVLLKCYQRLGYFPKLAEVPAVVVDHVRGKLELADVVEAGHESDRTLWRHRDFVRTRLGVKYTPARPRASCPAAPANSTPTSLRRPRAALDDGQAVDQVAAAFGVSRATLYRNLTRGTHVRRLTSDYRLARQVSGVFRSHPERARRSRWTPRSRST